MIHEMTSRQATAFRNTCFLAEETQHPRFCLRHPFPLDDVSTTLTVNVGME